MLYKLLVVDDEIEIRETICNYFPWEELGFEIVGQCENGRQALDFVLSRPVDVVLCDIKMPVMTGVELAKELLSVHSAAKVIFLSGHTDFEYAKQALVYRVKDYIVKPAKYEELMEVFTRIKKELEKEDAVKPLPSLAPEEAESGYNYDKEVIAQIKAYIEDHYKVVTLEEAARRVRMNPSYLSHFFKMKTGQNFSGYLMMIRMQKAASQLKDIHNKIYDVSENVGYTNPKNFTRTFKSYFGKTPKEFRHRTEGTPHEIG